MDLKAIIGKSPKELTEEERKALAGYALHLEQAEKSSGRKNEEKGN